MNAAVPLASLDTLPQTPASDVKKLGWRGVMATVQREGKVVVTNHNRPEAVILPAAEYTRLLQLLGDAGSEEEAVLSKLRRQFDARLAVLDAADARAKMRDALRKPLRLDGRVTAGEGH